MLISAEAEPKRQCSFAPLWEGFRDGAIIATGPAHASESYITLSLELRFTEPRIVSHMPLVEVLNNLTGQARQIIGLFDTGEP